MSHHRRFPRTSRLRRGYHVRQVDDFLVRVETGLSGAFTPMSASEIRRAGFELVRHGYEVPAVDAYLDQLEERVLSLQSVVGGRRGRVDVGGDAEFLRGQLDQPYMRRFPRAGLLRRGYEIDEVDEFIDRVILVLNGAGELSVEAVRDTTFHPKRGGYDEIAVDETLDRVVEILMVQRRSAGQSAPQHSVWDSWTRPGKSEEPGASRA